MLVRYLEAGMNRWLAALKLVGVGWYISLCILLGILAGRWLDSKFNTEPLLVIVGLILGLTIAFYGVYRMLLPGIRTKQDKGNS